MRNFTSLSAAEQRITPHNPSSLQPARRTARHSKIDLKLPEKYLSQINMGFRSLLRGVTNLAVENDIYLRHVFGSHRL